MSVPSYQDRYKAQVEEAVMEDLARAEYKTQALTYAAMAKNSVGTPEIATVYAQLSITYASLENARWAAKKK